MDSRLHPDSLAGWPVPPREVASGAPQAAWFMHQRPSPPRAGSPTSRAPATGPRSAPSIPAGGPGTIRVLALGASTTDQPVQSTEDTWAGQLELALRRRYPDTRFEVAAYGRGGETVDSRLRWARANLAAFQPDVVLTPRGRQRPGLERGARLPLRGAAGPRPPSRPSPPLPGPRTSSSADAWPSSSAR